MKNKTVDFSLAIMASTLVFYLGFASGMQHRPKPAPVPAVVQQSCTDHTGKRLELNSPCCIAKIAKRPEKTIHLPDPAPYYPDDFFTRDQQGIPIPNVEYVCPQNWYVQGGWNYKTGVPQDGMKPKCITQAEHDAWITMKDSLAKP